MKNKKLVIVDSGSDSLYETFIKNHVFKDNDVEFVSIKKAKEGKIKTSDISLILFTGGTDINPVMYGELIGKYTQQPDTTRDDEEMSLFRNFERFVPKLGICRGSQLLCALNGGSVVQHVNNDDKPHELVINEPIRRDELFSLKIPSDHHQMMYPYSISSKNYDILGWSKRYMSDIYLDGNNKDKILPDVFFEPEIVYFNRTNSLGIQFHPEYSSFSNVGKDYIGQLINRTLIIK